jgi:hypothetical protein
MLGMRMISKATRTGDTTGLSTATYSEHNG